METYFIFHLNFWSDEHILVIRISTAKALTKQEENVMSLNISSKQMDITPAIRTHIEERLAKLEKYHTQLINPHFMLIKQPNSFQVEATIGTPLGDLVAKAEHEDLYTAIFDVKKKLEGRLIKLKEKNEH
ncbi:sigma 54 modulation protein/ribosomal protein S30EA [Mannheimia haemolytica serotype A2 str. OVINE]|nr:sigma 54 modulation protein/ribosomal protein S30EA [Mannheimia haemolytica serotype A2 str. OVINE]EEY11853.1 sigma 54 modulation protein/ribosomal protein S30EA [Mannheimia haemolytica serotype A2 str. BOVINE]